MTESMRGLCDRGSSCGSPKGGFPGKVRPKERQKVKSFPCRELGGGKSCRQRENVSKGLEVFLENGESIRTRCLVEAEWLGEGGAIIEGCREPPS